MEYIPVIMIKDDLKHFPQFPLPEGYRFRNYREGDEVLWAEILTLVGELKSEEQALVHFRKEFGPYKEEMKSRCFFLEAPGGDTIGTSTAWYNSEFKDGKYGRIHWVAIRPDYQGKGLGKSITCITLDRLKQSHKKAYLTTQTTSYIAVNIYLEFGFEPYFFSNACSRAWHLLATKLKHPKLKRYL